MNKLLDFKGFTRRRRCAKLAAQIATLTGESIQDIVAKKPDELDTLEFLEWYQAFVKVYDRIPINFTDMVLGTAIIGVTLEHSGK